MQLNALSDDRKKRFFARHPLVGHQ